MSSPYLDFDRLKTLTVIDGSLINESPLRVGVGREAPLGSSIDNAVLRLKRGTELIPFIPGSSIKGVFRTFLEQLIRSEGGSVHPPWSPPKEEVDQRDPKPCVICGIFGNTRVASHIRIYDSMPTGDHKTLIKTGVSIDRDFGGQRPGLLYTEEFVQPKVEWSFRVDLINISIPIDPEDERVKLLSSLFQTLKQHGLQIGARRSVGAGLIKLKQATWTRYVPENGFLKKKGEGTL